MYMFSHLILVMNLLLVYYFNILSDKKLFSLNLKVILLHNNYILLFIFKNDDYQPNKKELEYSLHIIETIELELGLNISDNGEYDNLNIIQLKKDAAVSSRYWCLHNTGVHSVTIPLTELLDEFSKSVKGKTIGYKLVHIFFFFILNYIKRYR